MSFSGILRGAVTIYPVCTNGKIFLSYLSAKSVAWSKQKVVGVSLPFFFPFEVISFTNSDELKLMGVEFTHAIAWINVMREYASKKMVDERTAVWRLAEDLKAWQELDGFEQSIQNAKNQLTLLNMTLEQHKQAIAIVANLKASGMTDNDISNLVTPVSRWRCKVSQGNGSSFELDARINLPKTSTTTGLVRL